MINSFLFIKINHGYAQNTRFSLKDSSEKVINYTSRFSKPNLGQSPFSPFKGLNPQFSILNDSILILKRKSDNGQPIFRKFELSKEDYSNYQSNQALNSYWKEYSKNLDGQNAGQSRGILPDLKLPPLVDRIFGGDSNPNLGFNGSILVDVGYRNQFIDDPARPVQLRRIGNLFFNQQIQGNLTGKIGEKFNINARQDTKASFNFQNLIKFDWKTEPEDILQSIEVGNLNWTLNSQLIPGVENLFGLKTMLRFGAVDMTVVLAQQRSKQECITLKGGTTGKTFELRADNYDENRHFFLAQFFRENYERNLRNLPMVSSGFKITRVEVYVTNRNQNTTTLRNLVGLYELGDNKQKNQYVDNKNIGNYGKNFLDEFNNNPNLRKSNLANDILLNLYNLNRGTDFDILKGARKLTEREYTLHADLGYISLISPLRNDEILAVSYEYTYNGRRYKVGELTEDYTIKPEDEVIVLKLLKSATLRNFINTANPHPMWDLMLKNIYSLNVNSLQKEGFQLKIVYKDDASGIDNSNAIEGEGLFKDMPFVKALGFDKLNYAGDQNLDGNGNPLGDGNYDFIEGLTIDSKDGIIILPKLEPFGSKSMQTIFGSKQDKYSFDELYRMTQTDAAQITTKNKFFIRGSYQGGAGASSVNLFNVEPRSVKITAGGQSLLQGQDFLVDASGRVTILNQSIYNSGREIQVCYEKNDLFTNQIKTLLGTRLDFNISRNVHLGATFQKMRETPPAFFRRVAIGEEPVNNTMLGFDATVHSNSGAITKALDALPIVSTKEKSVFDFSGEFAQLIPGVNKRVQNNAFVDDFESVRTIFNLTRQDFTNSMSAWHLGSVPEDFLPNGSSRTDLSSNNKRAKISAYNVDVSIYGLGNFSNTIQSVDYNLIKNYHYERAISPIALYPAKDFVNNIINQPLNILDIAYFPAERGVYNYNENLRADGLLNIDPRENFGSLTRALSSDTDFDNSNIEIIEFWMMDPFADGESGIIRDGRFNQNNTTGGKVLLQLGDISEDFVPDGFYNFENGIPAEGIEVNNNVELTNWGLAPKRQFVINAFDNNGKAKQDIGLDGLASNDINGAEFTETFHFANYLNKIRPILNDDIYQKFEADASNDDYVYYLDDRFNQENSIIERYRDFMGLERNSELLNQQNANGYSQANSILPDIEDLNNDNTVNDNESYFEYELDLKKGRLDNHPYVVDKLSENGVNWYLFRIPIKNPNNYRAVNNPSFKSVRFLRMVMTEFSQPIVLRMSQFQLSGYNYRTFRGKIDEYGGFDLLGQNTVEDPDTKFEVSTVNIEENGSSKDNTVQYVLPPGFVRDRDITSLNTPRLNEQSLRLTVENLKPGKAQGVFRNTSFDFINYKNLKLFVSLQDFPGRKDDLRNAAVFFRLGTDLTDNYYEVQTLNLTKTEVKAGSYSDIEVWPLENEIDISFDDLKLVKIERDKTKSALNKRFSKKVISSSGKEYLITVMGRPDQSTILNTMLGIRNISEALNDNLSCSIWFNELRASGFDQTAGAAAIGNMSIKLADIGNIVANGNFNNYGFGGVQTKISQRSREENLAYGFTINLNLDRFLPEKLNLKIPFFITYDRKNISPHFDPLDPDIVLKQSLNKLETETERADYLRLVQDNTVRKGYNFTNVKRMRGKNAKFILPISLSNFTFNYSYSELSRSNTLIQDYALSNYKGSIFYNYSPKPINFEPFSSIKSNSPWLSLIKDFNFNPLPSALLMKLDMDRNFIKTQLRNADLTIEGVPAQFEKYWFLNRDYALSWNFTKSLNLNYKTTVNAIIDEPYGDLASQADKDSVWTNIRNLGRPKVFDQQISLDYRLPLDKLPLTDWMEMSYNHKINFNFWANSLGLKDENGESFGNIIKNSKDRTLSGQVDFVALYNRISALRWANSPVILGKDIARNPGDDEDINIPPKTVGKSLTRLLMSVRGIRVNYNILETTVLPGFLPSPTGVFGMTSSSDGPGWPFIWGDQNDQIRFKASENGWLTKSIEQNIAFTQTRQQKLSYSGQIDPNNNLRITVEGNYNRGDNFQVFYRPSQIGGDFENQSPVRSGNYSMTFLSFKTAFKNQDEVFETFRSNREILKTRLNNSLNFQENVLYDKNSQDVLIPAFFAAYSGVSAETVKYSPFYDIPLPNWKLDYNGLNLMPFINKNFSSFRITHQYSSVYSVGNFVSSLNYGEFLDDYRNLTLNSLLYPLSSRFEQKVLPGGETVFSLIPVYVMSNITFQEKFSPLIGFNAITKSKVSLNFEYAQDRNVGLNLSNSQVAELSNKDLTFGIGFTKSNVTLPIRVGGKRVQLPNDLRFTSNLTIRDTRTLQRKLDAESIITQGFINFQFRPQLSYNISDKFSVMVYYDRMFNNPLVSNSYYRRVGQGGFQIRYSL